MIKKSIFFAAMTIVPSISFAKSPPIPDGYQIQKKIKLPEILQPNTDNLETSIPKPDFIRTSPTIQIAIILDTSGSMNGLIDTAKTHLWRIVNELSLANKSNTDVRIQASLLEYGKQSLPASTGYIQVLSPLTYDLDSVSESLFSLKTNGGEELAGQSIKKAIDSLSWSDHPDDLKVIVIAGNESFNQGSYSYIESINEATQNNIIVNTVFCGPYKQGINLDWEDGAKLGKGKYMNINQDQAYVAIKTPYDHEITKIGTALDETIIPYTQKGKEFLSRSSSLDSKSSSISESVLTDRVIAKSVSSNYNQDWDLVQIASKNLSRALQLAKEVDSFQGYSEQEIVDKINDKTQERAKLKSSLSELNKLRTSYINEAQKNKSLESFGSILSSTLKEQAVSSGFSFK
ncbi:VWA domain-containing protein [Pseudoalteromonas sp. OFAV1]|jgi:hypothetical protein|uniref:vWA domain-containing protein n=1 Tax=Pseudoalteromonas sp. OFAV1 TaxID=2908892 RepID=UPI001F2C34B6|nr:vWA domain-containing protein [Pseudoalteromonas sp. OFAV1]MCF2903004.1 VWA domain-containing protein [Pseudoalteromonas sp. OFAV1]